MGNDNATKEEETNRDIVTVRLDEPPACDYSRDAPTGTNQYQEPEVNRDMVTVDKGPAPARDYSREAPTGNSVSYALRRLQRNRPDLYGQVIAGELSAHEAMVQAGFRDKQIMIPAEPRKAARRLRLHFTDEQFSELTDEWLKIREEIRERS